MKLRAHPIRAFSALYVVLAIAGAWTLTHYLDVSHLAAWLVSANVMVLPLWAWDKRQARRDGFRVPEASLHLFAAAGAAAGSLLAMRILRHKTLKPKFRWLYWTFLAVQVGLLVYWLWSPAEAE